MGLERIRRRCWNEFNQQRLKHSLTLQIKRIPYDDKMPTRKLMKRAKISCTLYKKKLFFYVKNFHTTRKYNEA